MIVLDFIRNNENWEELLAAEPYHIRASWDGDYVLLKYNQLASDFTQEIVRECRGAIFYIPKHNHKRVQVVCYPFYKFGNYGESYVPEIDWSTASVQEKVDGSLIKMWYHDGSWHVSTNGIIHAVNAGTSMPGLSFFSVVCKAIPRKYCLIDFFDALDKDYAYMFELVSPETRMTIEYSAPALYYLGARDMYTLQEVAYPEETDDAVFFECVKLPKRYPLHTIEQCIEVAQSMGADEEGFVVCDGAFNRIKIKSPEYLMAARVRNNNIITVKRVVEAMRGGYLDDLYAYLPDYHPYIDDILNAYRSIAMKCDHAHQAVVERMKENPSLRLFEAVQMEEPAYQDYCFRRISGRVHDGFDYLDNRVLFGNIVDWIKAEMQIE